MFLKKSQLFIFLLLLILTILSFKFFSLAIKTDFSTYVPAVNPCENRTNFVLSPYLTKPTSENLLKDFPYKVYLDSASICDITTLQKHLKELNILFPEGAVKLYGISTNQQILAEALTNKLEERVQKSFKTYNPDSLIIMMQRAEKFEAYATIDSVNSMLYQSIYDHWMNFISNTLGEYYAADESVRNNYKFRYLNSKCQEKGYGTSVKESDTEKVVYYVNEGKWLYLLNKFWLDTDISFKLMVASVLAFIFFPYLYILKVRFSSSKL